MTTLREAAQQALEALEKYRKMMFVEAGCRFGEGDSAITALRAALAEQPAGPDAEPVAWRWLYRGSPDSEKCFPMPGPDADVIAKAGASEFPRTVQYLYTAPQPAKPAEQGPKRDLMWSTVAMQKRHDERIGRIVNTLEQIKQEQLAEQPESLDWVSLNKAADEIVRSKPTWKRFIDGTPLANDIACWMADFALEHTSPQPAKPAEQEPVALLHDDGYWTAAKTDAGRRLSERLLFAGSPSIAVYTAPQLRRRLTDEEIDNTTRKQVDDLLDHIYEYGTAAEGIIERVRAIARAIERAHGIGEQP